MMGSKFSGVWTALVTPFHNGQVDTESLMNLVQRQVAEGVNGLVLGGTTAESPTLEPDELEEIFEIVQDHVGPEFPLMVGTGLNSTSKTIESTKRAASWGASGALVVVPYYNKPPQRGLVAHFEKVAESTDIPIVLYNVPGRTMSKLEADSIIKLSRHPNIAGLKDATGDLGELQKIKSEVNPEFSLLSGDDSTAMEYCAQGGHGVIGVATHLIAEPTLKCLREIKENPAQANAAIASFHKQFDELIGLLYTESNPICVKMALFMMKALKSPELRLPLVSLDEKYHEDLRQCLVKNRLL